MRTKAPPNKGTPYAASLLRTNKKSPTLNNFPLGPQSHHRLHSVHLLYLLDLGAHISNEKISTVLSGPLISRI